MQYGLTLQSPMTWSIVSCTSSTSQKVRGFPVIHVVPQQPSCASQPSATCTPQLAKSVVGCHLHSSLCAWKCCYREPKMQLRGGVGWRFSCCAGTDESIHGGHYDSSWIQVSYWATPPVSKPTLHLVPHEREAQEMSQSHHYPCQGYQLFHWPGDKISTVKEQPVKVLAVGIASLLLITIVVLRLRRLPGKDWQQSLRLTSPES